MSERKPYFLSGEDGAAWPAWLAAWRGLAQLGYKVPQLDPDAEPAPCPSCNNGECWEYMGTHPGPAGGYSHSFRHRDYPGAGRLSVGVPVEGVEEDVPADVQLPGMLHLIELQMGAAVQAGATEGQLLAAVAAACFDDHGKPVRR